MMCLRRTFNALLTIVGLSFLFLTAAPVGAETLSDYALKCEQATGLTVPAFDCNAGREVPLTHPMPPDGKYGDRDFKCDEPNRLNKECDPGSKFQVLQQNEKGFVVAHCRNQGRNPQRFGDIAVIQHSTVNGATCFYQAIAGNVSTALRPRSGYRTAEELPALAPAPINGQGSPKKFWLTPAQIARSVFACGRCHDNGPLIRSPYVAQMNSGPNALPGAGDFTFNRADKPYAFVGQAFKGWKAYRVEIDGNRCLDCHRLGVSNLSRRETGTAIDFALRATSPSKKGEVRGQLPEPSKNPYTDDGDPATTESHIWMPPGANGYTAEMRAAAQAVHDCAMRVRQRPLPDSPTCRLVLYATSIEAN